MFDRVTCKMPLPDVGLQLGADFQTKSMRRELASYVIDEDGQLLKGDERTNYTGCFQFYDMMEPKFGWCEFAALFDKGKCIGIVRVHDED